MFQDVLFFVYIFAGFAGLLAIILAVLLLRYWSSGNRNMLAAIRNLTICTAMIDSLYFYFEYEALSHIARGNFAVRIADILFFIGQVFFWCVYIREKSGIRGPKVDRMRKTTLVITAVCILLAIVEYGFLMDDYYIVRAPSERNAALVIEALLSILLTFINLWHVKAGLLEVPEKKCRRCIALISGMLIVNGTWNGYIVAHLILNRREFIRDEVFDPTPVFILIINLLIMLLIFGEDFSSLFVAQGGSSGDEAAGRRAADSIGTTGIPAPADPAAALARRLDIIAETHRLTEREREVLGYAYRRMTNPEIADALCISKYTVKNHMHRIFEKLDISSRADLILFVDREEPDSHRNPSIL